MSKELASEVKRQGANFLDTFKKFRKVADHRLRLQHQDGAGGKEIARQRADLMDLLIRELLEVICVQTGTRLAGLAIAAFGGYGRREMNPFSDVDIMFIHQRQQSLPQWEEVIGRTLVTLWDLGFKIGHSVRSITQAIEQANADLVIKTSILECRFLTGDRKVFNEFITQFEKQCVLGREAEYFSWRAARQTDLRNKFGASVFMQEPNVKSGCGGLRDYHNLLWNSYFKEGISSTAKLVEKGILRNSERRLLEKGYDFLLRVRTELHYLNGRPQDQLTLRLQGQAATSFHYPQKNILRRSEAFMRDYYKNARNIHLITQTALARMKLTGLPEDRGLLSLFTRRSIIHFDGFNARGGLIYPKSRTVFNENPARLMHVFQHAQVRQLEFSEELRDLIRHRISLINRTFQYAKGPREIFLAILSRKGEVGRILRLMHDLGALGKFIPEFGDLTCLVQHEFYHRYTADEHTLVCIEKLDRVLFSDLRKLAGYQALFQKIEDPSILYLAILLHDTGKAADARHHEEASAELAAQVARRFQLSPERRRMLVTLVNAHYTLSHTSQTRNLDDTATIQEFAKVIHTPAILEALMLLTLADGMGTSDQSWSDWKEALVWQLYRDTLKYLEAGPEAFEAKQQGLEAVRQAVSEKLTRGGYAEEIEGHFAFMPERYFRIFEPQQIVAHIRLFRKFFHHLQRAEGQASVSAIFKWIARPEHGHSEVWVCGWDRPRLLERIAGAFLSAQINILSADVFTRSDNLVLDIFRVCGTDLQPVLEQRDIQRVQTRLQESLLYEDFDFRPLIKKGIRLRAYHLSQEAELPVRIAVNNSSHPFYTLIDIQTPDRLGLLYDLLRALGKEGIFIELSRITTEMDVAMDSFYLLGRDGQKLSDPAQIKRAQQLLHHAAVSPASPDS